VVPYRIERIAPTAYSSAISVGEEITMDVVPCGFARFASKSNADVVAITSLRA
jgi:hypothetical protein